MIASARTYGIGIVLSPDDAEGATTALCRAGERLNYRVVVAGDPAELDASTIDFVLADVAGPPLTLKCAPVFGIVREAQAALWNDEDWFQRLSSYDGFVCNSEPVQRLLRGLCLAEGREPCVGFFELMPERQLVGCQIEKVIGLGAFRVCYVGDAEHLGQPALLAALSDRPYLRLYNQKQNGADPQAGARWQPLPASGGSAQRLYAGFGGGLVIADGRATADTAALHRLGEIVSVGAVAICPDLPWIHRYFGESVCYYPPDETAEAAQTVDRLIEEIERDVGRAVERARGARAIFEEKLSAEIMLANVVEVFEQWRARSAGPDRSSAAGAVVDTTARGVGPVFTRLSNRTLISVAQNTAALGPLQPVPNWRFGAFTESRDLAVHVRHSLWIAAQARGSKLPVIMPWHGGTRLRLYLDNDLSRTLFSGGCFEPNEFALLDRILQPGMVFVDGGANEGAYAIFAAARVGPAGRVIAVEPSRREVERLRGNIALNRLRNTAVVEAALAEASGSVELLVAEPEHAGQNTLGAFAYSIRSVGTEHVTAITVDEVVEQHELTQLDVLKLDLEGAELRALKGARRTLAANKPMVLTEVLGSALASQGSSAAALFELMEDGGYVLLAIDDVTGEPVPLQSTHPAPSGNVVFVHIDRDWGLLASNPGV